MRGFSMKNGVIERNYKDSSGCCIRPRLRDYLNHANFLDSRTVI